MSLELSFAVVEHIESVLTAFAPNFIAFGFVLFGCILKRAVIFLLRECTRYLIRYNQFVPIFEVKLYYLNFFINA